MFLILSSSSTLYNKTFQEITSLCSQLAYTYSANRNASYPFSLLYTSLNGRTMARLESMNNAGYKRWTEAEWWMEGYEHLWTMSEMKGQPPDMTSMDESQAPGSTSSLTVRAPAKCPQNAVIYLTADSEEELLELRPEETYIIGGICDHNRYKVGRWCIFQKSFD